MKRLEKILFALAIVSLVFIIIIAPLKYNVFNLDYYNAQFDKNNVDVKNQDLIIENLMVFFKGDSRLYYFTLDEQLHLEDVRILLNKFFLLLNFSLFVFVASLLALYLINKKEFISRKLKILFLGGLSAFALIALLFLAALNFSSTFQIFHEIFFPQGNYTFPADSLLITLFPENFFQSFFLRLIITSVILSFLFMMPQLIKNKFFK